MTAISSYTAQLVQRIAPEAAPVIIPFGAAVEAAAYQRSRSRSRAAPYEVLFVGRLVERKGVAVLLEAIAQLRVLHHVRLRVIGEGPLRISLESRAAELELGDAVVFEGAVPHSTLQQRFIDGDVLVLPAVVDAKGDTEGLGVVLIEALSHGIPVVASAVGGIPDIVQDGKTGLLVPPGDAASLAQAISQLISDPSRAIALAAAGREHVEREFSWPAITGKLIQLYSRLVE